MTAKIVPLRPQDETVLMILESLARDLGKQSEFVVAVACHEGHMSYRIKAPAEIVALIGATLTQHAVIMAAMGFPAPGAKGGA